MPVERLADPRDGGKGETSSRLLRLTVSGRWTGDVETVNQSRCFRSRADAGCVTGRGLRVAGCNHDLGGTRVLQEDGRAVRGYGDGENPSVL